MPDIVEIDIIPTPLRQEVVEALNRRGLLEHSETGQGQLTLQVDSDSEFAGTILSALDDAIAKSGLPLMSCRTARAHYVTYPPAA